MNDESLMARAIDAAERRKVAGLGLDEPNENLTWADDLGARAIFSGFDIDYDDLHEASQNIGAYFAIHARLSPHFQHLIFAAAWTDGVLMGLYIAKLQAEEDATDN